MTASVTILPMTSTLVAAPLIRLTVQPDAEKMDCANLQRS
ncbi:hypothetical protein [Phyllobacterium sp. 1468]